MKVLLRTNMIAVHHQAHFLPNQITSPTSHTSRTSGCRKQNSHTTRLVYRTRPAVAAVKMRPGTRPRKLYDQGKLIIDNTMNSLKSRPAVFCHEHVRYWMALPCSDSTCLARIASADSSVSETWP